MTFDGAAAAANCDSPLTFFRKSYGIIHTSMNGKSIPTELSPTASLAARLLFFLNFKRLKVWLWWLGFILIVAACLFVEIQTSLLQSWFFTSTNDLGERSLARYGNYDP